ncbi:MAG TPA: PIG-L family deacetylase [Polyangiaceae bacterium]|nr:PIG-L family deacetylase [Polyangiaceae bacterium]
MANARETRTPRAAVIVAHPDDEVLWCGGFMLERPGWDWFVLTLCRGSDADRSVRFRRALQALHARGAMADLDDGAEQRPLPLALLLDTLATGLPANNYDLILTHGPRGEYTRHLRHEECCRAVAALWTSRQVHCAQVKLFAYSDDAGLGCPHVRADADEQYELTPQTFERKYQLITDIYGFGKDSWEARTTPATEGFDRADSPSRMNELVLASSTREIKA